MADQARPVPFWVTFKGHKPGCVEAPTLLEAATEAQRLTNGSAVETCQRLPYPATPRLNQYEDPQYGVTPAFCHAPEKCQGRTSCPQRRSCTD